MRWLLLCRQWIQKYPSVGLALVTLLIFLPSLNFEILYWDDREHLCRYSAMIPVALKSFSEIWSQPHFGLYIPVTYSFFALIMATGQWLLNQPGACLELASGFHGFNVCLHVMNVCLVYKLFSILLANKSEPLSGNKESGGATVQLLAATGVFALHPLQVETVAWVSCARELLGVGFGLVACIALIHRKAAWAIGLCLLSLLSKPTMIAFVIIAPLFALQVSKKLDRRLLIFVFVLSCFAVWDVIYTQRVQPAFAAAAEIPFYLKPTFYLFSLGFFIFKTFLPMDLIPDYGYSVQYLQTHPGYLSMGLIFVAFLVLAWQGGRVNPIAFIPLVAAIAPVSGLVNFNFEQISLVSDRYYYLPLFCLGYCMISAQLKFFRKKYLVLPMLLAFAILSENQLWHWRSDLSLFSQNAEVNPTSALAHSNRANALFHLDQFGEAEIEYQRALELKDSDPQTWLGLARTQEMLHKVDLAEATYRKTIEKNLALPETFNNLAVILANKATWTDCESLWLKAIHLNENYFDAIYNLGQFYSAANKIGEARSFFLRAKKIAPLDERPIQMLEKLNYR